MIKALLGGSSSTGSRPSRRRPDSKTSAPKSSSRKSTGGDDRDRDRSRGDLSESTTLLNDDRNVNDAASAASTYFTAEPGIYAPSEPLIKRGSDRDRDRRDRDRDRDRGDPREK